MTFHLEQSGRQGSIPVRAPPLESHDKGRELDLICYTSVIQALGARNATLPLRTFLGPSFMVVSHETIVDYTVSYDKTEGKRHTSKRKTLHVNIDNNMEKQRELQSTKLEDFMKR